jgi:hypothetical protein
MLQWLRPWRGRDEQQLVKPRLLDHFDPLEELIRVVKRSARP